VSRLRWGILGSADFAWRRALPAMRQCPSVALAGIASRDRAKGERFREAFDIQRSYDSYQALIEDPGIEAIYIPLPNSLHADWAIRAIRAGKHVLCEKPFACSAAEAEAVACAASEAGVFAVEAFMWRFHSQHRRALEVVRSGAIGPVRLLRAAFSFPFLRKPNIRFDPALGGGVLLDLGCYCIGAARFYFESEPVSCRARAEVDPGCGVDTTLCAILDFPGGRAMMDCSFVLPVRRQIEIVGEKGIIQIPKPWQPDPESQIFVNEAAETFAPENHYVAMFEDFSHAVLWGHAPRYAGDDAVRQAAALDLIRGSLQS
jgi:D-xylose 1-dehydrogenase (NADP+, D-xylono-1,5-lactone-forming)